MEKNQPNYLCLFYTKKYSKYLTKPNNMVYLYKQPYTNKHFLPVIALVLSLRGAYPELAEG